MGYFSKTCAKTHLPVVVAELGHKVEDLGAKEVPEL